MNEPKVHLLKSGMMIDKIMIFFMIIIITAITLYLLFILHTKEEVVIPTTSEPIFTKKLKLQLQFVQHHLH